MRLLYIKLFFLIGVFGLFLAGCSSDAYAAIGSVSGEVIVKPTGAGVANIWVEWRSPVINPISHSDADNVDIVNGWPAEGPVGIRYTQTDSSGKFFFPHWAFASTPGRSDRTDKGAVSYAIIDNRAKQFLTWIKPAEPNIPPDLTAVNLYNQTLDEMNYNYDADLANNSDGQGLRQFRKIIAQASKYHPTGTGWVRVANRTDLNGGFQCNAPPTITAIKPANFKGFFDNNDQQLHNWGNGYTPIVVPNPIEFVPQSPIGFHDGEGINAQIPNQGNLNSCSVFGWAKKMDSTQQLDVQIFIGGPMGSGAPSIKIKADKARGDLGPFGFDTRLPEQYHDGVKRDIYVYAIDTDGSLTPLSQTPRSLVCGTSTASPTPTLAPTPQPALSPKVDIWAESGSQVTGRGTPGGTLKINFDQPTTIAWTSQNSSSCVASGNWAGVKQAGTARLSQQLSKVSPGLTYNYTLTCFNNETGEQESDTVIISVNPGTEKPFIQTEEGDVHSNEGINIPH